MSFERTLGDIGVIRNTKAEFLDINKMLKCILDFIIDFQETAGKGIDALEVQETDLTKWLAVSQSFMAIPVKKAFSDVSGRRMQMFKDIYEQLENTIESVSEIENEQEKLESQIISLENKKDHIQQQITALKNKLKTISGELDINISEKEKLNSQIQNMQSQNDEISEIIPKLKVQYEETEVKLNDEKNKAEILKNKYAETKKQYDILSEKNQKINTEISGLDADLTELKIEYENIQKEKLSLEENKENLLNNINNMKKDYENLTEQVKANKESIDGYTRKIEEKNAEIAENNILLSDVKTKSETLENSLVNVILKKEEYEKSLAENTTEYEIEKNKIEELKSKINSLDVNIKSLEELSETLTDDKIKREKECAVKQASYNKLDGEVKNIIQEIVCIEQKIIDIEQEISEKNAVLEEKEREKQQKNNEISEKQKDISELKNICDKISEKIIELNKTKTKCEENLAKNRGELENITKAIEKCETEKTALDKSIKAQNAKLISANCDLNNKQKKSGEISEQYSKLKNEIENLENEMIQLEKECEQKKSDINDVNQKIEYLNSKNSEYREFLLSDEHKRQLAEKEKYEKILRQYQCAVTEIFGSVPPKSLSSLIPKYENLKKDLQKNLDDAHNYFRSISESYVKIIEKMEEEINKL